MTEQTNAWTARGRFLHSVQKKLAEFERRETEFSKMLRKERAAELHSAVRATELSRTTCLNRPRWCGHLSHKMMAASVTTRGNFGWSFRKRGCDAAELLELGEAALDEMALGIAVLVASTG